MTNLSVLVQLYSNLSESEKQRFLKSLAETEKTVTKDLPETKDEFLSTLRAKKLTACPHCKSTNFVKNGHSKDGQRYLCKSCKCTFCSATKSLTSYSKHDISVWKKYVHCMMNRLSIRASARECGLSVKTSFEWRHKILDALQKRAKAVKLDGIVEADETFFRLSFKGNHKKSGFKIPKKEKVVGVNGNKVSKRGISRDQVCVPCAIVNGKAVSRISNLGRPNVQSLRAVFTKRVKEGSVLVTDRNYSYKIMSELENLDLVQILSAKKKSGVFTIQHINSYHAQLKSFMYPFRGVATKYLNNYLVWHNFTNHASGSFEVKERRMFNTANRVWANTKSATLSHRDPVPVLIS